MIRVVIADDEYQVREGMLECIDWAAGGMQVVACASDGPEAYSMITTHHPELVFLDIRMPGMSGLEVIRKAQNELEHCPVFVILTGYDEFSYAREAMKLDVDEYILKPFKPKDIFYAAMKSIHRIDLVNRVLWKLGGDVSSLHKLDESSNLTVKYPHSQEAELISAIRKGTASDCSNALFFFQKALNDNNSKSATLVYGWLVLLLELFRLVRDESDANPLQLLPEIINEPPLLSELLHKVVKKAFLFLRDSRQQEHPIIGTVKNYIEQHYYHPLTLKKLANCFHINSSYLSTLFSQQIGMSITEYIHQMRVDKAMYLLINTNLKTSEIAEQVGYTNIKYFYRIFKKKTGVTMGQFRTRR